jgi:hypothetical protein
LLKMQKHIKILIQGAIILLALSVAALLIAAYQNSILMFVPPIGFVFFLLISYLIQPLIIGIINIIALHQNYHFESWRTGFWTNGLLLFLAFSSLNLLLQTTANIHFTPYLAAAEIILLSYPFGWLARFSNGPFRKP